MFYTSTLYSFATLHTLDHHDIYNTSSQMWLSDGYVLLIVIHKAKACIYHALEHVHIKRGRRKWLLFLKRQAKTVIETSCQDDFHFTNI